MPSLGFGKLLSSSSSKNIQSQETEYKKTRARASSDKNSRNRSRSPRPFTPPNGDRSTSDSYFSPARKRTPRTESVVETDDYGFPVFDPNYEQFQPEFDRPQPSNRPIIKGRCRTCNKSYQTAGLTIWKCDNCFTSNGYSSASVRIELQRELKPLSITKTLEILDAVVDDALSKAGDNKTGETKVDQPDDLGNDSNQAVDSEDFLSLPVVPIQSSQRRGSAPDSSRPTSSSGFPNGLVRQSMKRKPPGQLNFEASLRPRIPSSPRLSPANLPNKTGLTFPEPLTPNWNLGGAAPKTPETVQRQNRANSIRSSLGPIYDHLVEVLKRSNLNISFSTIGHNRRGRSLEVKQSQRKTSQEVRNSSQSSRVFPMDHKNLMIGDVYDVASSLVSEQSSPAKRSDSTTESRGPKLVDYGSPHLDWKHIQKWYQIVLSPTVKSIVSGEELEASSSHLNKVEIKISAPVLDILAQKIRLAVLDLLEQLLTGPQKAPSDPKDLRYLLILLANPLLTSPKEYPVRHRSKRSRSATIPTRDRPSNSRHPSPHRPAVKRSLISPRQLRVLSLILGVISNLSPECHNYLIQWFSRYPEDLFRRHVDMLLEFLNERISLSNLSDSAYRSSKSKNHGNIPTSHLFKEYLHTDLSHLDEPQYDWQLRAACKVLQLFVRANDIYHIKSVGRNIGSYSASTRKRQPTKQLVSTDHFYIDQLDIPEKFNARKDFDDWEKKRPGIQLTQFPFLLSLGRKTQILEFDAKRKMENKVRQEFFDSLSRNVNIDRFFHLRVRRSCIIEDSLQRVSEATNASEEEAKKALKVHFDGEDGIDAGGLRKEWFLLLVKELFDPDVGLFLYNEETNYCYFNHNSLESSEQYQLVGAVLGLAIYNFTILDVPFPPFLFKKLAAAAPPTMGADLRQGWRPTWKPELNDLAQYEPSLARNLQHILDYEGNISEDIGIFFHVDSDQYGKTQTIPLVPGGENRAVNKKNREEYVDLYVEHILDKSIRKQFEPFARGFFNVCGGNALSLFRGEEIELLIRGSGELDLPSLRGLTEYENWREGPNGPDITTPQKVEEVFPVVKWFWELMSLSSTEDQRRVLRWITGSDRVPATGTTGLKFRIQCLGEDTGRLPQARTCFNMLQLWNYGSKAVFVKKFWYAVVESEGFGLK